MLFNKAIFISVLIGFSSVVFADDHEKPQQKITPFQVIDDEPLDETQWGIRNGCVRISTIDSINYFSARTAKVKMRGNKAVLMIFKNDCRSLRSNAAIIRSRADTLCEGFDSIRIHQRGSICMIESIEPLVAIGDAGVVKDKGAVKDK